MLVKEVNRSAAVAWSPLTRHPKLFACGTLAGTMNVDFDPTGKLEIFDLSETASIHLKDPLDMACIGSTPTSERFHKLAWKNLLPDVYQHGIIAGGFGSGTINIWNPTPLIERDSGVDPLLASVQSHSGTVKAFDFNALQPNLLASGGPSGEVLIWNLANPSKPSVHTPGNAPPSPNSADVTSVAWHPKHRHILAASSYNGTTVIWDLREKRPAFSFSDPNRSFRCRSIAWHPEQPMQIAAASDDDETPFIHLWDLHMTMAPSSTLRGHQRGVMSISWCQADKSILASTGKDNRTLCWDITTSQLITEVGASTNWNLDVQWSPKMPTMLSTCSLEGKVRVYSLHDFENIPTPQSTQIANQKLHQTAESGQTNDDDLFNSKSGARSHQNRSLSALHAAARQIENGAQIPPRPPVWLKRPCGVSFAFGGRLISFGKQKAILQQNNQQNGQQNNQQSQNGQLQNSQSAQSQNTQVKHHTVTVTQIIDENEMTERADKLDAAVQSGDLKSFCNYKLDHITNKQPQERDTWGFLASFFESKPRQEILSFLNFDPEIVSANVNEYLRSLPTPKGMLESEEEQHESNGFKNNQDKSSNSLANGNDEDRGSSPIPTDLFGPNIGEEAAFKIPTSSIEAEEAKRRLSSMNDENNVQNKEPKNPLKSGPPIHFGTKDVSESMLTQALLVGDFEAAVECCVRLGKMADALVLAACGGKSLWNQTQNIFFRQNKDTPYIALISSIANKDLESLIARVELECWKEALAILCSYSPKEEFEQHCEALAQRLEKAGQISNAILCYICAGSVDRVTSIWLKEQMKRETKSNREIQSSKIHPCLEIQDLMEKIVVFCAAFQMNDSNMSELVLQQYTRYAEILANQGRFSTALSYLSKLQNVTNNAQNPTAMATAILLDRVYYALPAQIAQTHYRGQAPSLYRNHALQHTQSSKSHTSTQKSNRGYQKTAINEPTATPKNKSAAFNPVTPVMGSNPNMGMNNVMINPNPLGGTQMNSNVVSNPSMMTPNLTKQPAMYQPPVLGGAPVAPQVHAHAGISANRHPSHSASQVTFVPVSPSPMVSTFNPSTAQPFNPSTVQPFNPAAQPFNPVAPATVAPPPASSSATKPHKPRTSVAVPSFTPSVPAAPVANNTVASQPPAKSEAVVKKKKKKTAAAPSPPSTGAVGGVGAINPINPINPAPASSAVGSILPNNPATASATYTAPAYAYSNTAAIQPMPAPKVRASRVQPPSFNLTPTTVGPVGAPMRGPALPPVSPAKVDPGTWNPQQPLPAHLTAGIHPPPMPMGNYPPPAAAAYQQPYPPPTSGFQPATFQPADANFAAPPPGAFQPMQSNLPPTSGFAPAPVTPAVVPPPKPGRAKKDPTAIPTNIPTPVYVTGPQAEAAASLKPHEPTEDELSVMSILVAVLDKIKATQDASHPDLVERYEDLKNRILTGTVPAPAVNALLTFSQLMNSSSYKEAQDKHIEMSKDFYHPIGSKAMLGLKRMLILARQYRL